MRTLPVLLFMLILAAQTHADPGAIAGTWLNGDGDGLIAIRVDDNEISATIIGSPNKDPNRPSTDIHNPDAALRDRPLLGLNIFSGFRYDGDGAWSDGRIYDPNSGKTYRCKLTLTSNTLLKVRGYIGFSLIGRTETWVRQETSD